MSNEQEMREAFERDLTSLPEFAGPTDEDWLWRKPERPDHYYLDAIQRRWEGWQAATLAAEETFNQRLVELTSRIRDLEALLDKASDYIPVRDTECRGYKCRKLNCRSCFDDETVDEYIEESKSLYSAIRAALTESNFTSLLERQYKENQG